MTILTAGATGLDVIQVGRGRDLVLLHSLLTDRTVFDPVIPLLGRDRRLTLVNLPGFGASAPAGPAIEDYADRVALLFPALGLEPATTDLVAMSFGGFVGIALAARHGHLFDRLILVDTAAAFPEPAKAPLRAMGERALRDGMSAVVDTALRRMFTARFIAARPDIVAARSQTLLRARPEHFATACRALADLDLRPALGKIANPTLVVVGALDVTTPPALAREIAAGIAGSRILEIPDCAHCPPIEQPEEFARVVGAFLASGRLRGEMIRHRLLEWQWSDYAAKHRNRANLLLHIVSVPLFQIGTVILAYAAIRLSGAAAGLAVACMVAALVAQGRGHRLEREAPEPFTGAGDFVSRFIAEQWVTFPRFVLSGAWYRNLCL